MIKKSREEMEWDSENINPLQRWKTNTTVVNLNTNIPIITLKANVIWLFQKVDARQSRSERCLPKVKRQIRGLFMKTPVNNKGECSRNEKDRFCCCPCRFTVGKSRKRRKMGCVKLASSWEMTFSLHRGLSYCHGILLTLAWVTCHLQADLCPIEAFSPLS